MNSLFKDCKTEATEQPTSGKSGISENGSDTMSCRTDEFTSLDANTDRLYNESEVKRTAKEEVSASVELLPEPNEPLTLNLENAISTDYMGAGGVNISYASMPLKDFTRAWLDTFKQNTIKTSSMERLEVSYNALLPYSIADMPIGDITAMDIQRYVNELVGKGYSINTIKKQLRIVTAPLKQAAGMRQIPTDPTFGVRLPREERLQKQTKEIEPYSNEEQARLWEVIDQSDHPSVLAIGFMLETGLRSGETMALRWEKVSIPGKRIRVDATITDPVGKTKSAYQHGGKSRASNRTIPLTPKAISLLEKLHSLPQADGEWVFPGANGTWISYQNLIKHLKQVCRKADVPYRGAHCLRHTFATNCYYKHMDVKILSRLLGHSDIQVTMNIYVSLRGDGFDDLYNALVS